MKASLLIPVEVKAIMVGANPPVRLYSNMANNFAALDRNFIEQDIESQLFQIKSEERPGIHLHWSLPDGLTHGRQQEENVIYPIVPNRWLITRLWEDKAAKKAASKAFILHSDILMEDCGKEFYNEYSKTYPYPQDLSYPYRYLGRSFPLKEVRPREGIPVRLTAVGPGTPHFAAYYPFCENVFGFYDTLTDEDGPLSGCNLTYTVYGWYEEVLNQEKEPLSDITSLSGCEEKFGWTLKIKEEPEFPMKMLCHGMISNLVWIDHNTRYETGVPSDVPPGKPVVEPKLAVGNNSAEAVAALLKPEEQSNGSNERLMQFLMNDQVFKLTEINGIIDAEMDLHAKEFQSLKPAELTDIKKKEGRENITYPPENVMQLLAAVRRLQRDVCQLGAELEKHKRSVYEIWREYTYRYLAKDSERIKSLSAKIYAGIDEIKKIQELSDQKNKEIETLGASLKKALGEDFEPVNKEDQRFYIPNNPALLLAGIDRSYSHGFDGRFEENNMLVCRTDSQLISMLTLGPIEGRLKTAVKLEAQDLLKDTGLTFPYAKELSGEAVLLSASFRGFLADKVMTAAGIVNPDQDTILYFTGLIAEAQKSGSAFNGAYPSAVALNEYKAGWNPLFLEWQLAFYPDEDILCASPQFSNWDFPGSDYVCIAEKNIIKAGKERILEGRMLITPHAAEQLSLQSKLALPDRTKLHERTGEAKLLSQAVSGVNEYFLMRRQEIAMPLFAPGREDREMARVVSAAVGEFCDTKPLFQKLFAPVRAGYFHISRLWITDSFGRYQELFEPDVYAAETMRSGEVTLVKEVMLPPRLVQPSRLFFQWICAEREEEAGFVPAASPICGWLLPNHFDQSIQVFTAEGTAIGSLQLIDFDKGLAWKNAPGEPFSPELPTDINIELYQLLQALLQAGSDAFIHYMGCIDTAFFEMHLAGLAPTEALFVGRPLAVVRAALELQQYGAPESYKLLEELPLKPDATYSTDIRQAEFSVRLGKREHKGDGLIGFYKMRGGKVDYGTFYSNRGPSCGTYLSGDNSLKLRVAAERAEKLTLLMEASGSVFIESGILPVKRVDLDKELVNQALDRLYFSIFMPSVLTDAAHIHMPLLKMDGKNWEWVSVNDDQTHKQGIIPDNTDSKAFFSEGQQSLIEGWLKMKQRQ